MSDLHLPDYIPVYPVTKEVKPRQRKVKLPDWGIEQRGTAGQNQTAPEWNVKWVLNPLRANTLDLFLSEQAKTGSWFLWTPPEAEQGRFRCDDWTKQLLACSIWEVQATFRQVFSFTLPELNASTGYFFLSSKKALYPFAGVFTLTGIDAQLARGYNFYANLGVFTSTGANVEFYRDYLLTATVSAFLLSGKSATLLVPGFALAPTTFEATATPSGVSLGALGLATPTPFVTLQLVVTPPTGNGSAQPTAVSLSQVGLNTPATGATLQLVVTAVDFF